MPGIVMVGDATMLEYHDCVVAGTEGDLLEERPVGRELAPERSLDVASGSTADARQPVRVGAAQTEHRSAAVRVHAGEVDQAERLGAPGWRGQRALPRVHCGAELGDVVPVELRRPGSRRSSPCPSGARR